MQPTEHDLSVARSIGSLQATAEATLRVVGELRDAFNEKTRNLSDGHEALTKRVESLERARAWVLGVGAAAGFIASKLGALLHFPQGQ